MITNQNKPKSVSVEQPFTTISLTNHLHNKNKIGIKTYIQRVINMLSYGGVSKM